jgi:type II secretory pathway pseudopilin PulG
MNRARRFSNQKGYNLIEAAIVLGIAGLVVGAIFAAWGAVTSQNKMRRAQDQITVIVNQIRSTYGNRNTLDNTSDGTAFTGALLSAGLLPDSWTTSNSSVIGNPYGGNILVTPDSVSSGGSKDAMSIALSGLGQADCYKLASNMVGSGRSQGLYKVNSTAVNNTTKFTDVKSGVCTSTVAPNTLTLYFSLKTGS